MTLMRKEEIEALVGLSGCVCAPWSYREGKDSYHILDRRGVAPMGISPRRTWVPEDNVQRYLAALVTAAPKLIAQALRCASLAERLSAINAASKADADDFARMRDGTKMTRAGLVDVIVYQQQELEQAEQELQQLKSHSSLARSGEVPTTESTASLRELVRLKDMKEWLDANRFNYVNGNLGVTNHERYEREVSEYAHLKLVAWEAARHALAAGTGHGNEPESGS